MTLVKWNVPLAPDGLPSTERANFQHLVMDIAWFGLGLAATSRFLSVYAIRIGATEVELGLLTSLPALILLISSSLSGVWMRHFRSITGALFLPSFGFRFVFLLPALTPFFPRQWQPAWLILSAALPALVQGISATVFVTMIRRSITDKQLPHLLSRRSIALNVTVAAGALAFGFWLEKAPFPLNYQLMFVVAFLCGLMSLRHCMRVNATAVACAVPAQDTAPANPPMLPVANVPNTERANPWKSRHFRGVVGVVMITHITFFSVAPIVPLHIVRNLGATEGFMALFAMIELAAGAAVGIFTPRLIRLIGTRSMIAIAMIGTGLAALVTAVAPNPMFTLIGAALSGAAWTTAATIGLFGYFTENTPSEHMVAYSSAYHQMLGAAVFIGPMIGSLLAKSGVPLVAVLIVGAMLRFLAAPLLEHHLLGKLKTVSAAASAKLRHAG